MKDMWRLFLLTALASVAVAACSSGASGSAATTEPAGQPPGQPTGESSATQTPPPTQRFETLQLVIAVSDLAAGPGNRVAFALIGPEGPIKAPTASASFVFLGGGGGGAGEKMTAVFRPWPVGPGGVYAVIVNFDRAGEWGMEANVFLPGGSLGIGRAKISVATASASPAVGVRPPASLNKTLADLDDPSDADQLAEITSAEEPDPDLYRMTVAEALDSGLPSIVTFSTPAFCQSATCGPQVEVVSAIKNRLVGKANFIHIEVYEDPHRLTDLSRARLVPQMAEWSILSEPFTFVLDRDGRVAAKFEGFVNEDELFDALQAVLGS